MGGHDTPAGRVKPSPPALSAGTTGEAAEARDARDPDPLDPRRPEGVPSAREGTGDLMSGRNRAKPQTKGTTRDEMRLEELAREVLTAILPGSVAARKEVGAVICRDGTTSALTVTDIRTSGQGLSVDVGLDEPNCGCPAGKAPVAFLHTHPIAEVSMGSDGNLHGDPDFSPQDRTLAKDHGLVAFLGSFDGAFRRYVPPKRETTMVDGRPVQVLPTNAEGQLVPEGPGQTDILNGRLPTFTPGASSNSPRPGSPKPGAMSPPPWR